MQTRARRIGFLIFDDVQALDVVGPADAFGSDAFASFGDDSSDAPSGAPYEIVLIGLTSLRVRSSSGVQLSAHVTADTPVDLDTLIVPGGKGLRRNGLDRRVAAWIVERASSVRRIASVCTGLYGLAPTGLLDGRHVTTHWSAAADIARRYPKLRVQSDQIFVKSGKYYSSAGVTAGIDLALAMIEDDHGPQAALEVAREMVVYVKRTGGQDQFSEPLQFQLESVDRFRNIAAWIHSHLRSDLSVATLAGRVNLSHRQFARAFAKEFGITPAAFVERTRLVEARQRLSTSRSGTDVAAVARSVGYASDDVFRRAFERHFGVSPSSYRDHFHIGHG